MSSFLSFKSVFFMCFSPGTAVQRQGRSGLANGGAEDRHGRAGLSNGGAKDRHGRRLPFDFSFDSFYSGRKQDLQDAVALESGTVRCVHI